jgi:tRNA(adenine34) deaminase
MDTRKSSKPTRRQALLMAAATSVMGLAMPASGAAAADEQYFVDEAFRMRAQAIAAGDQPYGAVMVLDGAIVGFGPSRVVTDGDLDAHAERVALWDARRRLGRAALTGAIIYSTSRPCLACQEALAQAEVAEMRVGPAGASAGAPRAAGA